MTHVHARAPRVLIKLGRSPYSHMQRPARARAQREPQGYALPNVVRPCCREAWRRGCAAATTCLPGCAAPLYVSLRCCFNLPDVAAHFHVGNRLPPLWGGSSRAARFARGAAALRQRARQRLASFNNKAWGPQATTCDKLRRRALTKTNIALRAPRGLYAARARRALARV